MVKAIYALYPDPDSAQRAVNSLRGAGVNDRDIAVVSSEPYDGYEFGRRDHRTRMPWLAALGGLLGGTSGFLLVATSQKAYPLSTGGMPIVAPWPDAIITYEMTMLGAILATLFTLLGTARLPNWNAQLNDPGIADGKILIGVVNPPESSRFELERRLREAGADQVRDFSLPSKTAGNSETQGTSS